MGIARFTSSQPNTGCVNVRALFGLLTAALLLGGCATHRELMPTPNLYQGATAPALFENLPDALRSNEIDLLYATDRAPIRDEDGTLSYGYERSRSAAFGSAIVTIEPDLPWDELTAASLERDRSKRLTLEMGPIREIGRFPETPPAIVVIDGVAQTDPAAREQVLVAQEALRTELRRRLALGGKR